MAKYGRIKKDGSLLQSSKQLEGFKPIEYAKIPVEFDQTTHYVEQSDPVDNGDRIFVDVLMYKLPQDLNEGDELDKNVL